MKERKKGKKEEKRETQRNFGIEGNELKKSVEKINSRLDQGEER